jgi:DNA-binding transcriptional ArsR family regulator
MGAARALDVLSDPAAVAAMLDPVRRRLLLSLQEPDSASGVARRIGLPRQKVNYHLRELEKAGLVTPVEERRKGNCVERLVVASATHYLVSPEALGSLGADPGAIRDRFSWGYLVAVAGRAIRELAILRRRADSVAKPLQTLTLESDVRFASQSDLAAFSEELANEIARLVAKYHDASALGGRKFRFFMGAYPAITKSEEQAQAEAAQAAARAEAELPSKPKSSKR